MKTKFYLLIAVVTLVFAACTSDDTADIIITDNSIDNSVTNNNTGGGNDPGNETIELSGVFTEDLVLEADKNYLITGVLQMEAGTTLTIPAGLTIRVRPVGVGAYIAIKQGARINAEGTSTNPIILTSDRPNPTSGDWGGIVICGFAPINSTPDGSTETAITEVGQLSYGGNNPADNSGILKYVRVEYAGGAINGNAELNGVSLYAVGNQTMVDFVQVFAASDDGFEFFGGTVNASHLSVVGSEDDSIDWTEGYVGTLTEVYVRHTGSHDKAFECDGYNTDFSNAGGYFSAPNVTNVTIEGNVGSIADNEAIRLRAGTQGIFTNVLINNFNEGFDLDGDTGDNPTGQGVLDGVLKVMDVTFNNVAVKLKNDTGYTFTEGDFISGDGNGTGTDYNSWKAGWTRD